MRDAMHQRKREREAEINAGVKRRRGNTIDLTGEEERSVRKGWVIDLTGGDDENRHQEEVDYAQSSEWSWPGSQEDA